MTMLWFSAFCLPLLAATVSALIGLVPGRTASPVRRWAMLLAPVTVLPALALSWFGRASDPIDIEWLLLGTRLQLDDIAAPLLTMTALLYGAALIAIYRSDVRNSPALSALMLVCFVGNAGVLVAGDAATFYFFFTLMSFVGYVLVVHNGTAAARRAGNIYLFFTVIGEGALLAALFLTVSAGGAYLVDAPGAVAAADQRNVIIGLLLLGFGIKAGTVPLHVWLPLAHPAAPTPASAVLSGAMVKAGLVGWIRFLPLGEIESPGWGNTFILLALIGALIAVPVGLLQKNVKVILAYSSISQLGFLATLIGAAFFQPELAGVCIAAAVIYAVHHGLAKGTLFLAIPLWKTYFATPLRLVVFGGYLFAAFAIVGAPLTSGYFAKYLSKESVGDTAWPQVAGLSPDLADILPWVGVGSTLLLARAAWVLFRTELPSERAPVSPALLPAWLVMLIAGLILTSSLATQSELYSPGWFDMSAWIDQLWPLGLGLVLATIGLTLSARDVGPSWVAHPDGEKVPPGDIVIVEEALWSRVMQVLYRWGEAWTRWWERFTRRVFSAPSALPLLAQWQARLDRWQVSGAIFLLLIAVAMLYVAVQPGAFS